MGFQTHQKKKSRKNTARFKNRKAKKESNTFQAKIACRKSIFNNSRRNYFIQKIRWHQSPILCAYIRLTYWALIDPKINNFFIWSSLHSSRICPYDHR